MDDVRGDWSRTVLRRFGFMFDNKWTFGSERLQRLSVTKRMGVRAAHSHTLADPGVSKVQDTQLQNGPSYRHRKKRVIRYKIAEE